MASAPANALPVRVVNAADLTLTVGSVDLGDLNGAATAAKQPALGTAGAASTDVITVQGITSMTPLLVSQSGAWTASVTQSGAWTVELSAATQAYAPVGSETALVVRPVVNNEELALDRKLQVLIDEIRLLRRAFLDWTGMGDPRHVFTDNLNVVQ